MTAFYMLLLPGITDWPPRENTVACPQVFRARVTKMLHTEPADGGDMHSSVPLPSARHCDRRAGGFTLLELLVVMVIIGLLAGYVGPKYFAQIGKSEVKAARAQIDALGKALDQFRLDTGHYPTTDEGLAALVLRPANEPRWDGPYLAKAVPDDPWGSPYQFKSPGEHGDYDLVSLGKDKQPGGEGEAADINSW